VYPKLIVAQLREAIVSGAEEKTIGEGKQIRLLHPKRSFEIAAEMSAEAE
jgi:hypothetical protein